MKYGKPIGFTRPAPPRDQYTPARSSQSKCEKKTGLHQATPTVTSQQKTSRA